MIRIAKPSDTRVITDLIFTGFKKTKSHDLVMSDVVNPAYTFYVYERDDNILSVCAVYNNYLYYVCTHQAHRHMGYASYIIEYVITTIPGYFLSLNGKVKSSN